jgi:hypothetical protein
MMSEHLSELASKSGISLEQAKKGLGTLLAALKHSMPEETFNKIAAAIPGTDQMLAAVPAEEGASGGILGTMKDLASKLFGGGGGAAALAKHFGEMGFSADQIKSFLPNVVEFLKSKLPPDLMKHVTALLPSS